jgi:Sulfotransferase domain
VVPDASYITVNRDGRDVFMSMYNHMRSMRQDVTTDLAMSAAREGIDLGSRGLPNVDDEHAFFPWWLENAGLLEHVASFWERRGEPNLLFVHYDDMTADLEGEMRRVAAFLAIEIDEAKLPGMVERCTFAGMKARPDEIGPFERRFVGGAESFLYKGTNGRWRDVMTDEELDAYEARHRDAAVRRGHMARRSQRYRLTGAQSGSRPAMPMTRSSSGRSAATGTSGPNRPARESSCPGPENCATNPCTASSTAGFGSNG